MALFEKRTPTVETLTINQLTELFRDYGIACTPINLGRMIIEGKFPFAQGTYSEKGHPVYIIRKKAALAWLEDDCCLTQRKEAPRLAILDPRELMNYLWINYIDPSDEEEETA